MLHPSQPAVQRAGDTEERPDLRRTRPPGQDEGRPLHKEVALLPGPYDIPPKQSRGDGRQQVPPPLRAADVIGSIVGGGDREEGPCGEEDAHD